MDLESIKKKRLSEYAIDELRKFITNNNLKEGNKLPSERELVEKLQISKGSLREALRMLEITGLVEVMPGKGIFVRNLTGDLIIPLSSWVNRNKEEIYKHFEARLILEPEVAALAARRISKKYINRIKQNTLLQKNYPETELVAIISADIEFHRLVAEAAKNKTISLLMNSLARISFHGWKAALRVEGRNESAVQEHAQILSFLAKHDEDGARTAMQEHMLHSIQLLKNKGLNFLD
jgi:GntR family transcriptional regulator, transcriptional repressor for pyruvate dehydrogenase complex